MSETAQRLQETALSEFHGTEPSEVFLKQQAQLERLLDASNEELQSLEYFSYLPEVVGYVPQEERDRFESLDIERARAWSKGEGGLLGSEGNAIELADEFPGIFGIIEHDVDVLGFEIADYTDAVFAEFHRAHTVQGSTARTAGKHIDTFRYDPDEQNTISRFFYLIANRQATRYYQGPAEVETMRIAGKEVMFNNASAQADGLVAPAPDWAIVRLHVLSIHESPPFTETATRTLARVNIASHPKNSIG